MPVTLMAMWSLMPNKKGLSFGLTTVALFIGAVPAIIGNDLWMKNDWVVFFFMLAASISLLAGLFINYELRIRN
jgi:uncharacterized membrane protein (DUF2068 family)